MRRHARTELAAGCLLASVLVTGCVPATPDNGTYKDKTAQTLGGALSEVSTVQKTLESLHQGKMFRPTAIVQLRDSASSLDTNAGAFNEVHPPPDLDWLYKRTDTLLTQAQDTTNQAALAIERRRVDQYSKIAQDLGKLADQLDKLETRVS
jgi:hypothetical protein